MLRSTHRRAAVPGSLVTSPLPAGWTEHRAPTGHTYYYNAETKQSTYTKPVATPEPEELFIDYGATKPDQEMQASLHAMQEFHRNNDPILQRPGHFTGGQSNQDRNRDPSRPNRQGDRPKTKAAIPKCAPWVLVKTKYGRRFVHNTETKESLWKFPSEVMMAVIDMDRIEWEKKQKRAEDQRQQEQAEREAAAKEAEAKSAARPLSQGYDSDEYEEVEVTDDEGEAGADPATKRPRLADPPNQSGVGQPPQGPQEFNEDDIAWQLAQLEAEEEDPGYDYDFDDQNGDEEDGGMPLSNDDRDVLYRVMLDDHHISPFSTFDALIDTNTPTTNAVISDDRWTALPNMSSRRAAFDAWSRDRVAERNANEATEGDGAAQGSVNGALKKSEKPDPRVAYLRFLAKEATPKLYWPEFKRKFRKAPEMTDRYFADKDREKLYREYVTKLKTSDAERKKEFITLLKSLKPEDWQNVDIPLFAQRDLRYYGVRDEKSRQELVDGIKATTKP